MELNVFNGEFASHLLLCHLLIEQVFFQLSDIKACENVIKYLADENVQMCQLLLKKWNVLREIISLLQIPFNATIDFQKKKLTLSDVYGRWLGMQLHLEACLKRSSFKTGLTQHLLDALKSRNIVIFNNPLVSCALYLDPRYHKRLYDYPEKLVQAKNNMIKIWRRLIALQNIDSQPQTRSDSTLNVSSDSFSFEFNEEDAVAKYIHGEGQNSTQSSQNVEISSQSSATQKECDIESIIESFQPDIELKGISILEYWEKIKEKHPEMYQIAMVIFSVPPTEVQIERDFSALDFIFTKRRGNLCENRSEEIFLIHLNKDLFYDVNQDEIRQHKNILIENV